MGTTWGMHGLLQGMFEGSSMQSKNGGGRGNCRLNLVTVTCPSAPGARLAGTLLYHSKSQVAPPSRRLSWRRLAATARARTPLRQAQGRLSRQPASCRRYALGGLIGFQHGEI